jgi:hypothetical protein
MKVLLDECTPRILKRRLTGFEVSTVQEVGCAGIKNGELLALAEDQFDVFITTEQESALSAEPNRTPNGNHRVADQSGSNCRRTRAGYSKRVGEDRRRRLCRNTFTLKIEQTGSLFYVARFAGSFH